jgi:hypothetical protein
MSQESELTLRKSLDQIDRNRRWQIAAIIAVFVALLLKVLGFEMWFYRFSAPQNQELKIILATNLQLMVFTVIFCTLGVCIFVGRMTKKILQAIDLSSKS